MSARAERRRLWRDAWPRYTVPPYVTGHLPRADRRELWREWWPLPGPVAKPETRTPEARTARRGRPRAGVLAATAVALAALLLWGVMR